MPFLISEYLSSCFQRVGIWKADSTQTGQQENFSFFCRHSPARAETSCQSRQRPDKSHFPLTTVGKDRRKVKRHFQRLLGASQWLIVFSCLSSQARLLAQDCQHFTIHWCITERPLFNSNCQIFNPFYTLIFFGCLSGIFV